MTATIIESDVDTGFEEHVSEQLDDAIPCDFKSCDVEAEFILKFHCCSRKTFVCEEHMFFVFDEIKNMMNIGLSEGIIPLWMCFECRGLHGSLKCFNAVRIES